MDPITMASAVSAVISGAAGEAGEKLWDGLTALVRRPFGGGHAEGSGRTELVAVEQAPDDRDQVLMLMTVLAARAGAEKAFADDLQAWLEQVQRATVDVGGVRNTISGGHQVGHVFQGRDFHDLTFNWGPPTPQSG